jgi:hypothetical protein
LQQRGARVVPFLFSTQELIAADLRIIGPSLDWIVGTRDRTIATTSRICNLLKSLLGIT